MEKLAAVSQKTSIHQFGYETEKLVLSGIEKLVAVSASKLEGPFPAFSKNALSKFLEMPEEKKRTIQKQIVMLETIISEENIEITETPNHGEWPLIMKALTLYDLHMKDDFQKILQKDDVIEIYNEEHIQIFRTFNFYKYSAYSYLDLLVNEWFHLWERPRYLLEKLMAIGQAIVGGERRGVVSMSHIPQHVYREIYNSEDNKNFQVRSVLCKFGHISPLYKADNSIGGFIINCRVEVLGYGEETRNISFI